MNIGTVKDVEVITPLNSCWEAPENDLAGKRLHCFISDEYSDDEAMAVLMLRALSGKPLTVSVREWLGDDDASTSEIPEIVLSMLKSRDQYPLVLGVGIGKFGSPELMTSNTDNVRIVDPNKYGTGQIPYSVSSRIFRKYGKYMISDGVVRKMFDNVILESHDVYRVDLNPYLGMHLFERIIKCKNDIESWIPELSKLSDTDIVPTGADDGCYIG